MFGSRGLDDDEEDNERDDVYGKTTEFEEVLGCLQSTGLVRK